MSPIRAVALALTLVLVPAACAERARNPAHPASLVISPVAWTTGDWIAHTFRLTIDGAGRGTLTWRTYRTCGQDAPPCDTFRGNGIYDGGKATLIVTSIEPTTATGRVLSSSDPARLPIGAVALRFDPKNDVLDMRPSPRANQSLCGPHAPPVRCG